MARRGRSTEREGFEETGTLPPVASGLGEGYVCLVRTL